MGRPFWAAPGALRPATPQTATPPAAAASPAAKPAPAAQAAKPAPAAQAAAKPAAPAKSPSLSPFPSEMHVALSLPITEVLDRKGPIRDLVCALHIATSV